ncbi:MAG: hypothetical protein Q7R81_06880 [Candidatus Peregrinibacteria bacterium]|nr:hypothetical protein [Candidatus Peregrinibacteria bacterium]
MSKRISLPATLLVLLLLLEAGTPPNLALAQAGTEEQERTDCDINEELFPPRNFFPHEDTEEAAFPPPPVPSWADTYHYTVNGVINAHLILPSTASCPWHTLGEATPFITRPATEELKALARKLPAWEEQADDLYEAEMADVLSEFQREYSCAMRQYGSNVIPEIYADFTERALIPDDDSASIDSNTILQEKTRRVNRILLEAEISKRALFRTLAFIANMDRLRPLEGVLGCFTLVSLDIRNLLGLATEATACLPRVWDVRSSLRNVSANPAPATPYPTSLSTPSNTILHTIPSYPSEFRTTLPPSWGEMRTTSNVEMHTPEPIDPQDVPVLTPVE